MKKMIVSALLLVVLGSCQQDFNPGTNGSSLTVRSGTSFGMCVGYCQQEVVIDNKNTVFTKTSREPDKNPTINCQKQTDMGTWNDIATKVNFDAFQKVPETLGCPDCADGGAEYVEIQLNDSRHRVTFEYNKTIPGFEDLVSAVRQQRNAFADCK